MFLKNLSLAKKIGFGFAVVLVLTVLVGLTGHYAVSRVIHDAYFNQKIEEIQGIFGKAQLEAKNYLLHNHRDGRQAQALAMKNLLAILDRSKAAILMMTETKGIEPGLKNTLSAAMEEVGGFQVAFTAFDDAEKAKDHLVKTTLAEMTLLVKKISAIKFWIEEMLPASRAALARCDSYMDRQTESRWKRLEDSYVLLGKAIDNWYKRIERSEKLRTTGDRLKQRYGSIGDLIKKFHAQVRHQDTMLAEMASHEAKLEKLLARLAEAVLEKMEHLESIASRLIWGALFAALLLGCAFAFLSIGSIVQPVKRVALGLKEIATGEGDLTRRLPVQGRDEVGQLARWFNQFLEKLRLIIVEISANAASLKRSSENLLNLSAKVASASSEMSGQSESVSMAAREMSGQMESVTSSSTDANEKMDVVAAAIEQMSATLAEIARNTEDGREITSRAVERSQVASGKINELGKAAQEISHVTEVITEISEQTNLLALNATIEAARAGEAGKGFAVVANEIKQLARQTAEATGKIKQQIDGIQDSTRDTVGAIGRILETIDQVNEVVSSISDRVEEQSAATGEIAGNVEQAAAGMENINQSVSVGTEVAGRIVEEIVRINENISQTTVQSNKTQSEANTLMKMAETLHDLVSRFKI